MANSEEKQRIELDPDTEGVKFFIGDGNRIVGYIHPSGELELFAADASTMEITPLAANRIRLRVR